MNLVVVNAFTVNKNGDTFDVEWFVRNATTNIDATGVVSTFLLPPAGLSYVSHDVAPTNGVYNPLLATWTVGTLYRGTYKKIKIKYRVDDITLLNMVIKQTITLNESDAVIGNNTRRVFISKTGTAVCDPENFVTPTIEISSDSIYELINIGSNDVIICPCCTKAYTVVPGSSVNITVHSISQDGYAKVTRTDPYKDSSFQVTAACTNCSDGASYNSAATATITVNKLFTGKVKEYEAIVTLKADGSAPVPYVVNNDFSGTLVWTRTAAGKYLVTLANAFTWFNTTVYSLPDYETGFSFDGGRLSDNTVGFTHDVGGVVGDPASDVLVCVLIKVRTPDVPLSPTTSVSPTQTASVTPSISITKSVTPSISISPSVTSSITVSISISASSSITPSITASITESISITPSVTVTPSNSATPSITPSITASITESISITPSVSITPSITASISITPSISVTPSTSV